MDDPHLQKRIEKMDIGISDSYFFSQAFSLVVQAQKRVISHIIDPLLRVALEEYDEISQKADRSQFQESCAIRNVLKTRTLATLLINDKGELILEALPPVIASFEKHLYSLGPGRQHDSTRQEHILSVLKSLQIDKDLVRMLQVISRPIGHRYADQIIRDTLALPAEASLTDAHARRAVLAAWLCTLRQNVGSCFATAPAILIHDEQPASLLRDFNDLLATGRMKRTYGGIEYTVPFSSSWGSGDLKKPIYIPPGYLMEEIPLWEAPGLMAACEAADIFPPDLKLSAKESFLKQHILAILKRQEAPEGMVVTAENLLNILLREKLQLSQKDLDDYQNRPKNLFQTSLMQVASRPDAPGSKGDLSASFFVLQEKAFNSFKALVDNALLKAWEFTLASLSESKLEFTRWNLYASLGFGAQQEGGIGAKLYETLKGKIEDFNRKVQDIQFEYEHLFAQLKQLEVRVKYATSEQDAKWINIEYQAKRNEFYTLEAIRDDWNAKAQRLAQAFDHLVDLYDRLFPQYFQEVYDADMHDVSAGPFDDSPAGFRLLYKHGRSNTSQWTPIYSPQEFIDALSAFLIMSESEVRNDPFFKEIDDEMSDIVTTLVLHVKTHEFLESALYRMAAAHRTSIPKNPLEHLDKVEKKPWVYTSGGTMKTLLSQYFRREQPPTESARWVENPTELLVFFEDVIKQLPLRNQEEYLRNPKKNMLMHSPTHAFNLKPGFRPFCEAWQNDAFTYTWIRDQWLAPHQKFVETIWLDRESIDYLLEQLLTQVPKNHHHTLNKLFHHREAEMQTHEFRRWVVDQLPQKNAVLTPDDIDSFLYRMLPLTQRSQLGQRLREIFQKTPEITPEKIERLLETCEKLDSGWTSRMIGARQLQDICLGLLCLDADSPSSSLPFHEWISRAAQKMGYAMPLPVLFADTNWVKDYFAFVVNPGTHQVDFWRVDALGSTGAPMSYWAQWLNGLRRDIPWGVYIRPWEYTE